MQQTPTYENILQRMLDTVPNNVDKREGSIIYDALAPAAVELQEMYIQLETMQQESFADSANGDYLSRRTAEFGVSRKEATKAIRKGEFKDSTGNGWDVPIGSRFSLEEVNYVVIEKIAVGEYELECETTGKVGNQHFGTLIPLQYMNGLASAQLSDILIPGEDEETDEALRERFFSVVKESAFGGNIADYMQSINNLDGVGGVKVFPTWNGGGTVKCTIMTSDYEAPSTSLIQEVQTFIDPLGNQGDDQGKGIGIAPIGHVVTIYGVSPVTIDVSTTLTLNEGTTIGQVTESMEYAINEYLETLRKQWAAEKQLIVRVSLIDAAILTVKGVLDVNGTTINDGGNMTLNTEEIPMLGSVNIT
ncbi:baseplate J/gp47 family protein [Longirhabdus pacifica]|uniref:baseplate J/gp47 family protein n=1 Tax=Longirhabdus pacifica TaxID=2305227 RepID=UPI0010086B28|nr:baseplate J/gp47 family protein [Longirhabdus pacifica]